MKSRTRERTLTKLFVQIKKMEPGRTIILKLEMQQEKPFMRVPTTYVFIKKEEQNSGPEVIKLFSYSTELSMQFIMLIHVKMPIIGNVINIIINH